MVPVPLIVLPPLSVNYNPSMMTSSDLVVIINTEKVVMMTNSPYKYEIFHILK